MNKQQSNGTSPAFASAERSEAERSENERSAAAANAHPSRQPNPEVRPTAQRRKFPAGYKQQILKETDAAAGSGAIGAVLRREGLYSSHLTKWRQERVAGVTQALAPHTRGPKPHADLSTRQIQQLRRENDRLVECLRKAEIIIDVQKKWPRCWAGQWSCPRICSDGRRPTAFRPGGYRARLRRA